MQSQTGPNMACELFDVLGKFGVVDKVSKWPLHPWDETKASSPVIQTGTVTGNGTSSNNTMAVMLAQLINHLEQTDRGRCLNHVLHLAVLHIINPFDAKPGQLDQAPAEATRELDIVSNELTSVGDPDDEEEEGEDATE